MRKKQLLSKAYQFFYARYIHHNTNTQTSQSSSTLVPFIITGTVVSAACSDIPHY